MTEPHQLTTPQGRRIAYHFTKGQGPCVVFLGGFKSDMTGTKAVYLQDWAEATGRAFLRLDYSGHGVSSGDFLDGAIGDWLEDALAVIGAVTSGPLVLVGSSMGGVDFAVGGTGDSGTDCRACRHRGRARFHRRFHVG